MKLSRLFSKVLASALLVFSMAGANAALITSTIGNTAHGLTDGASAPVFLLSGIQGGQPPPFDQSYGTDIGTDPSLLSWIFGLPTIVDPILSATLTVGIVDADTAAAGSQLDALQLEGAVNTAAQNDLNTVMEAAASETDEFNIFTINLPAAMFGALTDGSFTVGLDIGGAGRAFNLFPSPGNVDTATNGVNLIYSTLRISTQDAINPPNPSIPEPGTFLLFAFSLLGLKRISRR